MRHHALALALLCACPAKPGVRAPTLTISSFTLASSASELTVGPDGLVEQDGKPFGFISTSGRFVDVDGELLATIHGYIVRGPDNAILGEVDDRGSVTQTGKTVLSFANDGVARGDVVADYEQAIRFRGPADARPVAALVLLGLADSVAFFKSVSRTLGGDLETEARRFCDALAAGDAASLRAVMIDHASLAAVTRKAPPKNEYDAMVTEWIDARVGEMKRANKPAACARAEIIHRESLDPDDRLLKAINIAAAKPVLLIEGTERPAPFPILFIQTDGTWKVSIKK